MIRKRKSLPFPPQLEAAARFAAEPELEARAISNRLDELAREMEMLKARAVESVCGPTDESQDVELYDGLLGVTQDYVRRLERSVGQLRWATDLADVFSGPGESPGNVAGVRWASGALIGPDLFLTAGHAFDQDPGGWGLPSRNDRPISSEEAAMLMHVIFGYQVDGTATDRVKEGTTYPIVSLLEHRVGDLDFAVIRLGRGADGRLPSEAFGALPVAGAAPTLRGTPLAVISHPNGEPKKVEAGLLYESVSARIAYEGLDTRGGSSGAPVLSESGEIVGVHTNGGCTRIGGQNYGVTSHAIVDASAVVRASATPVVTPPTPTPPPTPYPPPHAPHPAPDDARLDRLERAFEAIAAQLGA